MKHNDGAFKYYQELKKDLKATEDEYKLIEQQAFRFAKNMLRVYFTFFVGQFGAMGSLIFYIYSWDVMESWTWVAQATLMVFGSAWFAKNSADFDERSVFEHYQKKKL